MEYDIGKKSLDYSELVHQEKIYKRWGFNENPYIHKPLNSQEEFENLFVGRIDEIVDFFKTLQGRTGAFCIEGDYGVGKSTFVNMCLWLATQRNDLIITNPIEIVSSNEARDFLLDILRVSIDKVKGYKNKFSKESNSLVYDMEYISTTGKETTKKGGFSAIVTGEVASTASKLWQKREYLTLDYLIDRLKMISDISKNELRRMIVISLDNLEKAKIQDRDYVVESVAQLRDLTFANYTFIFIGDVGLNTELSRGSGRLRSIFGNSLILTPLKLKEFRDAIYRRLTYISEDQKFIIPLNEEIVHYVYDKCNKKDIRWAFNFLNRIFDMMIKKNYKPKTYNFQEVREIILYIAKERFDALEDSEKRLIRALKKLGHCSPSDKLLQKECGVTRSTIQRTITKFRENPEILKRTSEGKRFEYELGYEMEILGEENIL